MVKPDSSRIMVFMIGRLNGLKVWTPSGGHSGAFEPETFSG